MSTTHDKTKGKQEGKRERGREIKSVCLCGNLALRLLISFQLLSVSFLASSSAS